MNSDSLGLTPEEIKFLKRKLLGFASDPIVVDDEQVTEALGFTRAGQKDPHKLTQDVFALGRLPYNFSKALVFRRAYEHEPFMRSEVSLRDSYQ